MTDSLFFDSDCLSAFLWVGKENLLVTLYPGKIVIPKPVYDELSYLDHLKAKVDSLVSSGQAYVESINIDTETYALYYQLTVEPLGGHPIIGKGEAATIALAKLNEGIVASNNMRDISSYISEFNLKHVTTGDILLEALKKGYITESQGNKIWASMLEKRRLLGAPSFTDFIQSKQK